MAFKLIIFFFFLSFQLHCLNAQTSIKVGVWYSLSPDMPIDGINSALFTHLACAFASADFNTTQLPDLSSYEKNYFSTFTDTVKRKNPSIKTLLSIYAGNRENSTAFFSLISQASYRKTFIESSIKKARLYGFDGLDLCCFLWGNSSDMANLGTFFNEWRAAVNSESRNSSKSPLLLTMGAPYAPTLGSVSYPVELMQRNLDWLHISAFDYYVPLKENFTRAHAALYDPLSQINTDFGIGEWMDRGLPASQLVLGLPFHGYAWTLVNPNDNALGAPASGPARTLDGKMGYKFIKNLIRNNSRGDASTYNATYVVNYYSIGSTWIGFDDVEAIRTKVSYAKEKGLLGYYVWHVANDDNWLLSRAAHGEFKDKDPPKLLHLLLIIFLTIAMVILVLGTMSYYFRRRVFKWKVTGAMDAGEKSLSNSNAPNLQVFSFADIKAATNDFSSENKLGQGGFGPVYKGEFLRGREIAVKRLSKTSTQGLEEFKNEVTLTATLQHVNLVRVLGFCTEGEEKMLVYEYMPNKSLDLYLFDPFKRYLLDWGKRIQIIEGITQGLLYLQEYSNLTIIHRDLKPSNILLDNEMNPKISDFGMARIFGKDEHEANTSRIVGTFGYAPPEYVRKGAYSMKYDVFSFGVLLLQIISGKKNTCFYGSNENLNLLEYAYELWKACRSMEFFDPSLDDSSSSCKLKKCMQIALLCVQENPVDRPSMLEVSSMLKNESAVITAPKKPAFSTRRDEDEEYISIQREQIFSINDTTISDMVPR